MQHVTVLAQEAIDVLNLGKGSVVVDCTLGAGGHAKEILRVIGDSGTYLGIDADRTAIAAAQYLKTQNGPTVHLMHGNFRNLSDILESLELTPDAILADLGWRMEQFDGSSGEKRGFSFREDEPLHMTFGSPEDYPFTAQDIVNEWGAEDIANVLYGYGEEHYSRRIAKAIVEKRSEGEIASSLQLAEIVAGSVPAAYRRKKTHPATKTFQALRIAVNDEFDALAALLRDGFAALPSGGRMAIITFHSLEDRIVKQTFREYARDECAVLVHKKPVVPSDTELQENPRSRSAKLRTIEKT